MEFAQWKNIQKYFLDKYARERPSCYVPDSENGSFFLKACFCSASGHPLFLAADDLEGSLPKRNRKSGHSTLPSITGNPVNEWSILAWVPIIWPVHSLTRWSGAQSRQWALIRWSALPALLSAQFLSVQVAVLFIQKRHSILIALFGVIFLIFPLQGH